MVGAAAEAASEAAADGTFDAANSLVGPGLTRFLQIYPVVTCQLVAVSALKMCMDIKRVKTTEGLNPMPFTAMLTNSVVWGLYGLGKRDFTSASPRPLCTTTRCPPSRGLESSSNNVRLCFIRSLRITT